MTSNEPLLAWDTPASVVDRIHARDWQTILDWYEEHKKRIIGVVFGECRRMHKLSYAEDCFQQLYADLSVYDFRNNKLLHKCMRNSFYGVMYGRSVLGTLSYDRPISDGDDTVLHFYGTYDLPSDRESEFESVANVVKIIERQTALSERQKDNLLAFCLDTRPYKGLYRYYYEQTKNVQS